tara:strand:+ start:1073 stop:1822 length:750 start_codon:yes stop_codon:yes gene_type:complete
MIAFCFLTYSDIIPIHIWNTFFGNIDKTKYKVFIHTKYNVNESKYLFPINTVKNKILTKSKTDITIVKATLQLLKESYHSDITHYIFLSQNCIPLYNFEILEKIIKNSTKSIVSFIDNNVKDRYHLLDNKIKNFINYKMFVKQQPNMILINNDVRDIINNDLTYYFKNMVCPDEHYFVNILLYILKKDIIKQQTHFCNYNLSRTQALEFKNKNMSKVFIDKIRSVGFLFMRKVSDDILNRNQIIQDLFY